MTNSELKKKILEATDNDWFNNVDETFDFSNVGFTLPLKGVSAIYEFVNQQISGWGKIEIVPEELKDNISYFSNLQNLIISFIDNYANQESNRNYYWHQNVKNQITNHSQYILPYNVPHLDFLLKVYKETPLYFQGAINFILQIDYKINSKDLLYGAILAYEFTLKDNTELTERRDAERKSISHIRNNFQKYLTESELQLSEHLKNADSKFDDYVKKIDDLKNDKNELFDAWFDKLKSDEWQKWYDAKINNLKKLEETYESKLKLEKPARYWEKKSTKYYTQGSEARNLLVGVIVFSLIFLGLILVLSPDWIFNNVFKGHEISIVRWSIVFITLLSLIAYTVRALSKYMFSSFHLARDAEERHTLTFFYLALLKDTEVKDEDRKMILQALFSRTDTGLLKDDSGSTMPNDTITKFIPK